MAPISRGILVAVEGIDGSGKSTLAKNLARLFVDNNLPVVLTKEPGGSKLGQYLRAIVQTHPVPVCQKAEYLLFAADRAQHFEEKIIPALAENKIVLSDRLSDSSLVYQGYGRGLELEMLNAINIWAMSGKKPDVVLYVKIDAQTAMKRILERTSTLSIYEKEECSFHERLVEGFEDLAQKNNNFITLDGLQDPQSLAHNAYEQLILWLKKNDILL